jgi:signal transduction histidine kinase
MEDVMIAHILDTPHFDYSSLATVLEQIPFFDRIEIQSEYNSDPHDEQQWWFMFPSFDEHHRSLCQVIAKKSSEAVRPVIYVSDVESLADLIPCLNEPYTDYVLVPFDLSFVKHRLSVFKDYIQARSLLGEVKHTNETILHVINHDVRNALTSINGLSDVILEDGVEDEDELAFMAASIRKSGRKLLDLINEMQDKYRQAN